MESSQYGVNIPGIETLRADQNEAIEIFWHGWLIKAHIQRRATGSLMCPSSQSRGSHSTFMATWSRENVRPGEAYCQSWHLLSQEDSSCPRLKYRSAGSSGQSQLLITAFQSGISQIQYLMGLNHFCQHDTQYSSSGEKHCNPLSMNTTAEGANQSICRSNRIWIWCRAYCMLYIFMCMGWEGVNSPVLYTIQFMNLIKLINFFQPKWIELKYCFD